MKIKKGKLKIIKAISHNREVACLNCQLVGYLAGKQTGFLNLSNQRQHQIQIKLLIGHLTQMSSVLAKELGGCFTLEICNFNFPN